MKIGIRKMNTEESKVFMGNIFEANKKMTEDSSYVHNEWVKTIKVSRKYLFKCAKWKWSCYA